jgi:hypothetical protein
MYLWHRIQDDRRAIDQHHDGDGKFYPATCSMFGRTIHDLHQDMFKARGHYFFIERFAEAQA